MLFCEVDEMIGAILPMAEGSIIAHGSCFTRFYAARYTEVYVGSQGFAESECLWYSISLPRKRW